MSTTSSESLACPVIQPGKLSRRGATAFHAFVLMSFLAASAAPTPLYRVYQQEWGFSATLLTVVFGAYALALLTALLTAGRLSDHIGRRPVIALALLLQSVAMCGFLLASGPGWLVGARLLQGAATGLATASVGAALLDLHRERGALINGISPMIGMAAGALGSTALLVHAPDPLHTVYALLLALFLLALALLWRVPETATRRDGAWASLRPRITVPPQARKALLGVTPANVAVWMLGGFYLSLMPSLIVSATQARSPWLGGFAVTALTLSGALAIALVALRRVGTFRTLLSGEIALASGLLLILIAANAGYPALLLAGSIVAGLGFGATFLGAVRTAAAGRAARTRRPDGRVLCRELSGQQCADHDRGLHGAARRAAGGGRRVWRDHPRAGGGGHRAGRDAATRLLAAGGCRPAAVNR